MIFFSPQSAATELAGSGAGHAGSADHFGQFHRALHRRRHVGSALLAQLPGQGGVRVGKVMVVVMDTGTQAILTCLIAIIIFNVTQTLIFNYYY